MVGGAKTEQSERLTDCDLAQTKGGGGVPSLVEGSLSVSRVSGSDPTQRDPMHHSCDLFPSLLPGSPIPPPW